MDLRCQSNSPEVFQLRFLKESMSQLADRICGEDTRFEFDFDSHRASVGDCRVRRKPRKHSDCLRLMLCIKEYDQPLYPGCSSITVQWKESGVGFSMYFAYTEDLN